MRRVIFILFIYCFLFSATEKDKTYDRLRMLVDILQHIKRNYVEEVDEEKLIYSAASGMLRSLDRYSAFLEARAREELEIETTGRYGGLGIKIGLSPEDGYIQIVTPFPGTPAFRMGLSPGDKIIKIEGESTKGIALQDAVKRLRGLPGTKVNITVLKKGEKEPIDMTLVREEIKIPVLSSRLFPDNIGYIKLNEFNQNTVPELKPAIKELKSKGMNSLILDLRYNPGGLLEVAKDVVELFLGDKKLIVYTKGRGPNSNREYYSEKTPFTDIPMIVLVNEGSASGSEIVAGALQDHRRALIIGTTTFGKASVQSVYKLPNNCAIKLTTARYYTPSGRCIEKDPKTGVGGIVPDFIVVVSSDVEKKLREAEIYYPDTAKKEQVKKDEEIKDPVIEKAVDILKGYNFFMKRR